VAGKVNEHVFLLLARELQSFIDIPDPMNRGLYRLVSQKSRR
jgi:hypothetical protein